MRLNINIPPTVLAALIMGSVLLSGFSTVNMVHHEVLPQVFAEQQIVTINPREGLYRLVGAKIIDIRIKSIIEEQDTVRAIVKALQEASRFDVVKFHIAGVGGEVDTVLNLINNVKATKAHVIMIVEAPSYSGHAYLALFGDELIMRPYSSLMFHTSSLYGYDCSQETGIDRTVLNSEHCQALYDAHIYLMNELIKSAPYLTLEQKISIMTGHDVFIQSDEFNKRT
jgi:ATP-dependent protease ClpP protease subunit